MTWFKIDDGFWSHPKTTMLSDAAVAVWVRAGAYSCQHLTDGFIAPPMLRMLGDRQAVDELVEAGLWEEVAGGWQFHDWGDYQETSETVKRRREQARERQRRSRAARENRRNATPVYSSNVTPPVTRDSTREFSTPDPTRPDPVGTYVPTHGSPNDVTTDRASETEEPPRGRAVDVDGWKLVREVIPADHPQAVRTALAVHAGAMLQQGIDAAQVRDALALWLTKPKLGPGVLPSLVSEVLRARSAPVDNGSHLTAREAEWIKAELMKDNPNPEVLRRAGIEMPSRPNLTALPGGL